MRILLIILAAVLVAAGSGFYLVQSLAPQPGPVTAEPAAAPPPVEVFVPAAAVAAGTILAPGDLARMPIAADAVTAEMIVADAEGREHLLGSVALHPLPAGVPIARSSVVQPGERGFLAAVLPKGRRAISIPITEVGGVSGLVMPGDRVDVILTYAVQGGDIDAERDIRASETVLSNLRVLALDQRLQAGQTPGETMMPDALPVARTVTLEVTPQAAEMLTLATQLGELSLVLNSVQDGGEALEMSQAGTALLPAALTAGGRAPSPPRPLTLDAEVTSLLQRERAPTRAQPAASAPPAAMPLAERVSRVQVVRGSHVGALEFGGRDPFAGAEGAAEPAAGLPPLETVATVRAAE